MSKQTNVRLPDETHQRLSALANETGRSASYYIREALDLHLDEIEDIYLAQKALINLKQGKDEVLSREAFWRDLEDLIFKISTKDHS